jgi:hypothetical protein
LTEDTDLKRFFGEITEKCSSHITNWNIKTFRQPSPKVTKSQDVLTRAGRMRAVGYVGVRTEDQVRDGVSLDVQQAMLEAYCLVNDWIL